LYTGTVEIPETVTYNDVICKVTGIGESAFSGCSGLTSVTIPNSVTSIGNQAFQGCYRLTSVTIPHSVTSIGASAFANCYGYYSRIGLTSITIPNSVTTIGSSAFSGCAGLTNVTIPNSLTSISSGLFSGCSGLTSIDIPNSVISIEEYAFEGCYSLSSINIPKSVKTIGDLAFAGCNGLTSVHITDLEAWCNINMNWQGGGPLEYAHHLVLNGEEITDLVIPNTITTIGYYAFSGCSGLTSVIIPNSVTSIDNWAFKDCNGLTNITIPNSVTSIGSGTFGSCSSLTSVIIPNSVTSIANYAFGNCSGLLDVYCNAENLPSTDANAFNDSYIEYVTLHVPESSLEAYKTTAPWSGFGEIVPLSPYTLTYYVDGEVYKTYLHEKGVAIPEEEAPEKEGYIFSGWSEIPETMPDHDVEVTGTFTVNKYNLIYMVDGEEYRTVEIEYGAEIIPEEAPEKEGYTFMGWSEIPEKMPANDVTVSGTFVKNSLGKCATPTIAFKDGKFKFESTEEGVEFVWSITIADSKEGRGNEADIKGIYKVSVYATKADYEDSDAATIEVDIRGKQGDVSGDGEVDATDITKLIDILLKKNTTTNTEQ
jgi:hypothetical protein